MRQREKLKTLFIIFPGKSFAGRTLFEKRVLPAPLSEKLKNPFIIFFREIFKGKPLFVKSGFPLTLSRETYKCIYNFF